MQHDWLPLGQQEFIYGSTATFPITIIINDDDTTFDNFRIQVFKAYAG